MCEAPARVQGRQYQPTVAGSYGYTADGPIVSFGTPIEQSEEF
jgi:hypothetical protein